MTKLDGKNYTLLMQKKLNVIKTQKAIDKAGLTQTAVAKKLDVSKEAVSQWLSEKSFPRPNKLLQLGKLLNLAFDDLVIREDPFTPKIAFRRMRGTITRDRHIQKAQEIGRLLRQLVPFLPFDTLEMPPVLKSPKNDYAYLRKASSKVREEINLEETDTIDFKHLIRRFDELQTVVVPILWGNKQRHENAVHIYLPDSQSTWVYLNLDTNVHDFKFWMAHELGHCMSPNLEGNKAEDFADAFAGSLLYPHELAENSYDSLCRKKSDSRKIAHVIDLAYEQVISPYTVIGQINKYAKHAKKAEINLNDGFNGAVTNFNKKFKDVSESIFSNSEQDEDGRPNAREYIHKVEYVFKTRFFELLRRYLKQNNKGPGFVQTVLDLAPLDARSIHKELT